MIVIQHVGLKGLAELLVKTARERSIERNRQNHKNLQSMSVNAKQPHQSD